MQLLFDLDGTLSDSRRGIVRCLVHTLQTLGHEVPSIPRLRLCVGPPLASVFQSLFTNYDSDHIERAIAIYRERYEAIGIRESALFPALRGDQSERLIRPHDAA